MADAPTLTPLWTPDSARVERARLTAFRRLIAERTGTLHADYASLHAWSLRDPEVFWRAVWDFCGVVGDAGPRAVVGYDRLPGARFFPDGRLNFAENLLRRRDAAPALLATTEAGVLRQWSFAELAVDVGRAARALRAAGVGAGDRVCGLVANVPEAVIAALGAAAIGAVWSSASPDFGVASVLDRFGQIDPSVFLFVEGYHYGGKYFDCTAKAREVAGRLPGVRRTILIPCDGAPASRLDPSWQRWSDWLASAPDAELTFERFPFAHPLYILYSSGTTGVPKSIVHSAGGTLLEHLKEHQLQADVRRDDRVFYFTTCGWMMWNWLVSALASEAAIVLFDGSPFFPDGRRLFDLADATGITLLGTSAKFLDAVRKAGLTPRTTHDLGSVRTIASTGSPLVAETFDFVHAEIKADVHLTSISGGTDIVGCFVGGDPTGPVWRGEIQAPGLGMDVRVYDADGNPIEDAAGELVCGKPFPSMPVEFWRDPDGARYRAAYFDRFPGVWCHGDWIRRTPHGGYIIYGRSDATLNPGGVRIGTAEIYRQVEQFPEVIESLAVGQQWDGDERIILFVRLAPGVGLDDDLRVRIARRIRTNASPRHVPARIVAVSDIPRTRSGKMVELAVRDVIHGRPVKSLEAIANPESLDLYRALPDLQS